MAKAIKTICIEIIMYLTIVTMCGHVIAHFWDYYVTRSELSEMKKTLELLKITINTMGNGYNRLDNEFSEIKKEESLDMPDMQRYNAKRHIYGVKKTPMKQIIKNVNQEDGLSSVERSTFKDRPTSPGSISSNGKRTVRDNSILGSPTPVRRNHNKDNQISSNINYSRRSDFSDIIGKPKMRCLCKQTRTFYECYDDEIKNSYLN